MEPELFKLLFIKSEQHVPFLISTFHFDFGYVWGLFVQVSGGYFKQSFAVGFLDGRTFDDERADVLEQVALMLVLKLQLRQLLGVQVLEELCVISLK